MDLIIKSYNRPYYLDRCLFSIQKFLTGFSGTITVIDDGTPGRYLQKIQQKYPHVKIRKTAYFSQKVAASTAGKEPNTNAIPAMDWVKTIQEASDYFMLLEDDMWFTQPLHCPELENELLKEQPIMLKLFWLGNPVLISGVTQRQNKIVLTYKPKLTTTNLFAYKLLFKTDRFKIRKVFSFLGWYSFQKEIAYYSLYSVAGAVFKKEYYLALWDNHGEEVNEGHQLCNAIRYFNQNAPLVYARTKHEVIRTGFSSSATTKLQVSDFSMPSLNAVLNQAWFEEQLISTEDLQHDMAAQLIEPILLKEPNGTVMVEKWQHWVTAFKKQFSSFGCQTE